MPQSTPQDYVAAGPPVFEVAPGSAGSLRLSVAVTLEADNVTGHSTTPDTRTACDPAVVLTR